MRYVRVVAAVLVVFVWAAVSVLPVAAVPKGWPEGWSERQTIITGQFLSGVAAVYDQKSDELILVWTEKDSDGMYLKCQRLQANTAAPVSEPVTIVGPTLQMGMASAELAVDGNLHIVWREWDQDYYRIEYAVVDNTGRLVRESTLDESTRELRYPDVDTQGGQIVIAWAGWFEDGYQIYLVSPTDGQVTSPAVAVESEKVINSLDVAAGEDTALLVWREDTFRDRRALAQAFQLNGEPASVRQELGLLPIDEPGPGFRTHYDALHRRYIVVYTGQPNPSSAPEIWARTFDQGGNSSEVPVKVTSSGARIYYANSYLSDDSVLNLIFLDTRTGNAELYYQRYDIDKNEDVQPATRLTVRHVTAKQGTTAAAPVILEDGAGELHAFWKAPASENGHSIVYMNTVYPAEVTRWDEIAIERENLLSNVLFNTGSAFLFSLLHVIWDSVTILLAAWLIIFLLIRVGVLPEQSPATLAVLIALMFLIKSIGNPLVIVDNYLLSSYSVVVFAAASLLTFAYYRLNRIRLDDHLAYFALGGLWIWWFDFMILLPGVGTGGALF